MESDGLLVVTLSRRNLETLLSLLDNDEGAVARKRIGNRMFYVTAEENEDHYDEDGRTR